MGRQFYVAKGKEKLGPYSRQQIIDGIASKIFLQDDLVWVEGMESWAKLKKVSLFKPYFEIETAQQTTMLFNKSDSKETLLHPFQVNSTIFRNTKEKSDFIDLNQMFQVSSSGKVVGEFSKSEIINGLRTGSFFLSDYVWQPDWTSWKLISDISIFSNCIGVDSNNGLIFSPDSNAFDFQNAKPVKKRTYIGPVFGVLTCLFFATLFFVKYYKFKPNVNGKNFVLKNNPNSEKIDSKVQVNSEEEELLVEISFWFWSSNILASSIKNQLNRQNFISVIKKIEPQIVKKRKVDLSKFQKGTVDVFEFEIYTSTDFIFEKGIVPKKSVSSLTGYIDKSDGNKKFIVSNLFDAIESVNKETIQALLRTHERLKPGSLTKSEFEDYLENLFIINLSNNLKVTKSSYEHYNEYKKGK